MKPESLPAAAPRFLDGGGELGALMRAYDWGKTPLGAPAAWPQSLKTAVRIMLTSRQPIWIGWGSELTYLYNDPYKSIIGGKHPAALGQPFSRVWREIWDVVGPMADTVMHRDEGTYVEAQLLIMERHGYQEETYYTFSYSPIPDDAGGPGGLICANSDDTRRVIGERQLALLRELAAHTATARSSQDACALSTESLATNLKDLPFALIFLGNPDGRTLTLAGTAGIEWERAASLPLSEALETNETRIVLLDTSFGELPSGAWDRAPAQAAVMPIAASGQTGRAGVLFVGLNPYRQFDESYRAFLELVSRQISASIANAQAYEEEKKRAEALAELDRAKTAFFSNVSHELRTPLTLMLGPVEDGLTDAEQPLPPAQRERLELVRRSGRRLQKLVNTLLDFSRIEAGRAQASYVPTDLAAFTADLASSFRSTIEQAGLRLAVDCPPLPEPAYVDRDLWEKIVLNLVSNAFKFTFEGEIAVSLRPAGELVELAVRDTGTGIPQAELPHVFDRFRRVEGARSRTHEGTGIGLALVQELVKLHGGTVRAASVPGKGSTFTVSIPGGKAHLPVERIDAARLVASTVLGTELYLEEALRWLPDAEPLPQPAEAGRRPRIVWADDNADMREYVRRLLSTRYEVEAVADGEAALAAVCARRPDLVLADVMMPKLDGLGLVRALRADAETRTLPAILLSARAGEESRIEALDAGADDYLYKPFSARELLAQVSARLELGRLRARLQQDRANLTSLFAQTPVATAVLRGPELVFEMANPAYLQVIGGRQAIGKPLLEAMPEAKGQGFDELLRGVMRTGIAHVGHETLVKLARNGTIEDTYFTFIYAPLRGDDGEVDRVIAIVNEVTEQVTARRKIERLAFEANAELAERRRAEAALRESERRLGFALEASQLGQWDLNLVDHTAFRTPQHDRIFGYESLLAEWTYEGFLEHVLPEDRAQAHARFQDALAGRNVWDIECRIRRVDGAVRWIWVHGQIERDSARAPVRMLGTVQDITERKDAETVLRQTQQNLADFVENATIGMHWVGPDGVILWANRAELDMLGYAREEYVGRHIAEFHADADAIEDILKRLRSDERLENYEARLLCRNGTTRHVLISSSVLRQDGEFIHTRCFTRDVTERMLAQNALQESEKRYRGIFQTAGVSIWEEDFSAVKSALDELKSAGVRDFRRYFAEHPEFVRRAAGMVKVRDANDAAVAMFGATDKSELLGSLDRIFVAETERVFMEELVAIAEGRATFESDAVSRTLQGERRDVLLTIAFPPADGAFDSVLVTMMDITERRRAEVALHEADRRKDEFLAMLSHELRNPLAPIRNAVSLLQDAPGDAGLIAQATGILDRQVDQLIRLVDDLLDIARISRGSIGLQKQPVALGAFIDAALETSRPLMQAAGHRLEVSLPPEPITLLADPVRMAQVVGNLLSNAARYTPNGGRIALTAEVKQGSVAISVRDNGIGIAAEALLRVFEMFTQIENARRRAPGGLGIGLALAKQLVELHGGCIEARSEGPGKGSEFTVRIPVPAMMPPVSPPAAKPQRKPDAGRRILIVDDNRDAAGSLGMLLEQMGHSVRICHDGRGGLAAARRDPPEIVLLDLTLPKLDGFAVAALLRQDRRFDRVPLVAVTGHGQDVDRRRAQQAGFDEHLVKPVDSGLVRAALQLIEWKKAPDGVLQAGRAVP